FLSIHTVTTATIPPIMRPEKYIGRTTDILTPFCISYALSRIVGILENNTSSIKHEMTLMR
ncbi:hypothetical protein, partial [Methanocorpusculum parvum]|uniref:hypothetical protein n=1 Tax=Methanocorpusculum parvum TaxID=2193 RepID=UPI00296E469D